MIDIEKPLFGNISCRENGDAVPKNASIQKTGTSHKTLGQKPKIELKAQL